MVQLPSPDDAKRLPPEELFKLLECGPEGLSSDEAARRRAQFGPNALEEKRTSALRDFMRFFWGPIPWMIEIAAVLSAVVGHWDELGIILAMLFINAGIGFWEQRHAANALEELKKQLAVRARVRRDGKWADVEAAEIVPGDVVGLELGRVVPADLKLFEGDYASIDQSALTGESLPATKKPGDVAYSGSAVKQGDMRGVATATGGATYFARTAKLVESAGAESHFQKAVIHIGDFLIVVAVALAVVLVAVEYFRGSPWLTLLQFVLILVVASIPVAMPAVLSVTMALGAMVLSRQKAVVSRLQSIEEMAGIDVLCSDKTGTLTQNKLTLDKPVPSGDRPVDEVLLTAALASKPDSADAIDQAVVGALADRGALGRYRVTGFTPFDPVRKRSEAAVEDREAREGGRFKAVKGAPQVVADLCKLGGDERGRVDGQVAEFASRGYRTLGVARAKEGGSWEFLGLLPLFDPPREDSRQTIGQAVAHGIGIKMVTGDNVAIARNIAGQLGMGANIHPAEDLFGEGGGTQLGRDAARRIEQADGFAQVFPEHKYDIVKALQDRGHLVAMTGDGVNDAPALKQADVGVAVSGATDAARAAASLVLTAPGLSVIINAVEEARRIFERMMSYTTYRIAMTVDIMIFVVLAIVISRVYPLTPVMIVLLALLDDIPIMTIAYDRTYLHRRPVRWQMRRTLLISSAMGLMALAESLGLFFIGWRHLGLDAGYLRTVMFLQLIVGGHLLLFLTRTRGLFWRRPHPSPVLLLAILGTQALAVAMTGFGWLVEAIPWSAIGLVWVYNIVWMFVQDFVKVGIYRLLSHGGHQRQGFLERANRPLHSHGHARGRGGQRSDE